MLRSIQEKAKIINSQVTKTILWSIILISIVISSLLFYATYLDVKSQSKIHYIKNTDVPTIEYKEKISSNAIVASRNGKKYYYSWCQGVEKIKPENLVTYASEEEAKANGKELSVNCRK